MTDDKNSYPFKYIGDAIQSNLPEKYRGHGWQTIFASDLGVTRQEINAWIRGKRKPGMDNLRKVAKIVGVTVAELTDESASSGTRKHLPGLDLGTRVEIEIPDYGSVAAATNGQDEFIDDSEADTFPIPIGTGVLKVKGSSMEPLARDGQRVFLRPSDSSVREGDLVAVWTNETPSRQLFKRWGGWVWKRAGKDSADDELILVSVNPIEAVNLTERIRRDELGGFRIVVGVWYG